MRRASQKITNFQIASVLTAAAALALSYPRAAQHAPVSITILDKEAPQLIDEIGQDLTDMENNCDSNPHYSNKIKSDLEKRYHLIYEKFGFFNFLMETKNASVKQDYEEFNSLMQSEIGDIDLKQLHQIVRKQKFIAKSKQSPDFNQIENALQIPQILIQSKENFNFDAPAVSSNKKVAAICNRWFRINRLGFLFSNDEADIDLNPNGKASVLASKPKFKIFGL